MSSGLTYREWAPPPGLRAWVRCVWGLWGDGVDGPPQPIVPDGCPEIVLNLADAFLSDRQGTWRKQPSTMLVGQTTGPTLLTPTGECRIVGIRLHPWAGFDVVGAPMAEVRDAFLSGPDVFGGWIVRLQHRIADLPAIAWSEAVYSAVAGRLSAARSRDTWLARAVVRRIASSAGRESVASLARGLGVSQRTLQRALGNDVGLPPVALARILRLQHALGRLLAEPSVSLGAVALASGYFDQPHFTREFRRLVGCAPSTFLGRDRDLTDPFIARASA